MQIIQTVAPTKEPISLEEAKEFIRILDNDSDALLMSLIIAVREHIENITNRQLEVATFELYSDFFEKRLPKNPIKSIEKIEYMDEEGTYVDLDKSLYYFYEDAGVGYIEYENLPYLNMHKKAVKITFIAGYDAVPESIKQYMKVKISTLFENREQYVIGASISDFGNKFVENILIPYKVIAV